MSTSAGLATIPALGKAELEYLAEEQMKAFARFDGKEAPAFMVWKFAAHFLKKKVSFEWLSNDGSILGLSCFVDGTAVPVFDPKANTVKWRELGANTILLSKKLENPHVSLGKPRFTLMHECAHHLLHTAHFRSMASLGSGKKVACSIQRDKDQRIPPPKETWTDEERMEWQANYFASALLMPESRVHFVMEKHGLEKAYSQRVMHQASEYYAFRTLVRSLAAVFRVSPTTAELRLEALGFERLQDLRPPKEDPWLDDYPAPKKSRLSKEEREWERVERSWDRVRERELKRKYE